jgi:hypothetical protein
MFFGIRVVILESFGKIQIIKFRKKCSLFSPETILSLDGIQVSILIEGTGLGVELYASPILLANIRIGEKSEVFVHHHINEAGQTLFGFTSLWKRKNSFVNFSKWMVSEERRL